MLFSFMDWPSVHQVRRSWSHPIVHIIDSVKEPGIELVGIRRGKARNAVAQKPGGALKLLLCPDLAAGCLVHKLAQSIQGATSRA